MCRGFHQADGVTFFRKIHDVPFVLFLAANEMQEKKDKEWRRIVKALSLIEAHSSVLGQRLFGHAGSFCVSQDSSNRKSLADMWSHHVLHI